MQLQHSSQMKNESWIKLWLCTMTITSAILVVFYTFVLIKIKANFILITKIVVLNLVQNLASFFVAYFFWVEAKFQNDPTTFNGNIDHYIWA